MMDPRKRIDMGRPWFCLMPLLICVSVALTAHTGHAQVILRREAGQPPQVDGERSKRKVPRVKQTKRVGQLQIISVIDGDPQKAIRLCEKFLQGDPNHLESLYNLSVAWCALGNNERALEYAQRAVAAGLPPGRLVAGPRELFEPLVETAEFQEFIAQHDVRLVHGPMLGCVTDRSAKFWVRTAEEAAVQIVLSPSKEMTEPLTSATVFTEANRDYTAVAEAQVLQPATVYYYDVLLNGQSTLTPKLPSFRTYPPAEQGARFQVAFGGGAGYTPRHERIWDVIAAHQPAALLFLGDNVYIDNPTRGGVQHYTYYRRQSRGEFRRLVAGTSIYAIWDDHDFGTDDCWYGPAIDKPPWKRDVWNVFRNNWNNPGYGGGKREPGCWYKFSIADVDFFMLDCRYYRNDPKGTDPSMLGRVQKEWLLKELRHSQATFKVLASSVPWVLSAKGKSLDTWRGFRAEREEIFSFLEEKRIDGVVLLSADRHRSDFWRIDRPAGYPLYEMESSRLTNIHLHPLMPGALFGYNRKCSFALLTFDTTAPDPKLTYQIFNIDNELIHTVVINRSVISHE